MLHTHTYTYICIYIYIYENLNRSKSHSDDPGAPRALAMTMAPFFRACLAPFPDMEEISPSKGMVFIASWGENDKGSIHLW